jgi:hypothetical protein
MGNEEQAPVEVEAIAACEDGVGGIAGQLGVAGAIAFGQVWQVGHDKIEVARYTLEQATLDDTYAVGDAEATRVRTWQQDGGGADVARPHSTRGRRARSRRSPATGADVGDARPPVADALRRGRLCQAFASSWLAAAPK